MKTDVTDMVQRYRLALRHIWNSCFWVDPDLRNWDSVSAFRDLKLPLFRAVIGDPLDLGPCERIFGPDFRVVAIEDLGGIPSLRINTRVPSRPDEGIWEVLNGPFEGEDVTLSLVDFFDWTPMGYIDLRYYVVLIEAFPRHPENVGRHALVEVSFVKCVLVG